MFQRNTMETVIAVEEKHVFHHENIPVVYQKDALTF